MAKLDGPLMSMGASGSIGGILTFGSNKGRNFVRQLVIPANPKTPAQQGVRSNMKFTGQEWAQLSDTDKATWEARAAQTNISAFAAFSSKSMDNWSNLKAAQRQDPAEVITVPVTLPTGITATVTERRVQFDWVDPVSVDLFGIVIYLSTTTGFTPGRDNAVIVIDANVLTAITATLAPGVWFYRLTAFDIAGNLTTPATAQGTFTIV